MNNGDFKNISFQEDTLMKRVIFTFLVITIVASAQAKYSGGTGASDNPYQIATAEDLNDIGNHIEDFNKCFILVNDINMAQYDSNQFNIIGDLNDSADPNSPSNIPFAGVFDGCGYKVINFKLDSGLDGVGLFSFVDFNGQILNTGIENADVNGHAGVGALVGLNRGIIENCYATGRVRGRNNAGGLVGKNAGGFITRCHSDMNVTGIGGAPFPFFIGGLVGQTDGNIADCHSSGTVSAYADVGGLVGSTGQYSYNVVERCSSDANVSGNYRYIGGLVGSNYYGKILCSSASGPVSGGEGVGGLIGYNNGEVNDSSNSASIVQGTSNVGGLIGYHFNYPINRCRSSSSVQGTEYVGGLVGRVFVADINQCSSSGTVTADSNWVGGLVGYVEQNSKIANCYSSSNVSGYRFVAGLIGYLNSMIHTRADYLYSMGSVTGSTNTGGLIAYKSPLIQVFNSFWDINTSGQGTSAGGTGRTTAQMKTMNTFTGAGWDFIWETTNGTADIWAMCDGNDYPRLNCHLLRGENNGDSFVNFVDFTRLGAYWLTTDSTFPCVGADLTGDSWVDLDDLVVFVNYWLKGL